jgi:hypothetical protein
MMTADATASPVCAPACCSSKCAGAHGSSAPDCGSARKGLVGSRETVETRRRGLGRDARPEPSHDEEARVRSAGEAAAVLKMSFTTVSKTPSGSQTAAETSAVAR